MLTRNLSAFSGKADIPEFRSNVGSMPQTHPSKAHPLELLPRYSLLRGEQPGVRACATESLGITQDRRGNRRSLS